MFFKLRLPLILILAALSTGCALEFEPQAAPSPTLFLITATLPPTSTLPPSHIPAPPTPAPTVAPVEGTTTTQVNVRGEPSTASPALEILGPFVKVQIVGVDPGGNWYQILFEPGPEGKGWVTAAYIQTASEPEVPVIGAGAGGTGAGSAVALQQINVRSGPGTDFNSLGTVNAQDVVTLTGKNADGTWLQIEFAAGPEGRGWVNAAFVQVSGDADLPIITEAGQVVGTGTPTGVPPTITPTVAAAASDDDSAAAPAVNVTFSPLGARSLFYTGEVSSPEGDGEDWVQFTSHGSVVSVRIECLGDGELALELWHGGQVISGWEELGCNSREQVIPVNAGEPYLVRVQANPAAEKLISVRYTLSISTVR